MMTAVALAARVVLGVRAWTMTASVTQLTAKYAITVHANQVVMPLIARYVWMVRANQAVPLMSAVITTPAEINVILAEVLHVLGHRQQY